jgi:CubicO group peptidase (beta-lactamase class C family)
MLGQIIENVSGQTYNDYMKEHILLPLGMNRSFYSKNDVDAADDVAVPYTLRTNQPPLPGRYLYRSIRSEGGLISSVMELSKAILMYLEGGKGIVSKATLDEMFQARVAMPWHTNPSLFAQNASSQADTHYAYGLATESFYNETLVGHGGSVGVATAHLAFLPKSNVGVALLCNGSGYPCSQFAKVALAVLLGKDVSELPFMQVEQGLDALTGTYESYKGTMSATLSKHADFLKFLIHEQAQPQEIILVPEKLGKESSSFFTLAAGRRLPVSFHKRKDTIELIYERYKFKRLGP